MKSSFSSCPHYEEFEESASLAAIGELLNWSVCVAILPSVNGAGGAYEAFADIASNDLAVAVAARESIEDTVSGDADQAGGSGSA